jgi:hypothetical protein
MQAAVELSRLRRDARFIMVGGCNISPEYGSDKVDAMVAYIQRENPAIGDRVVGLPSLPCTKHNLVAAFTLLQREGMLEESGATITVLTNEYHRPRTIAHGTRAWQEVAPSPAVGFHMPSAESVLGISITDVEATYPAEYIQRLALEAQGVVDIYDGTYTDSCFERYGEQLGPVLANYGSDLLTPSERQNIYAPQ